MNRSPAESADTPRCQEPRCESPAEQSEISICAAIFIFSVSYFLAFARYAGNSVVNGDEGIALQGAQRILRGEVLYRDFFSFYTPGSYYWNALVFKFFGSSLLAARATLAAEGAALCVLTYLLARRFAPRWGALLAAFAFSFAGLPHSFRALHNWDSTLFATMAAYCGMRCIERPSPIWGLALGACASLAFLFDQSRGAGLAIGLAAGVLVVAFGPSRTLLSSRIGAAFAAGVLSPLVVTLGYFAGQRALAVTLSSWFWPMSHYSAANQYAFGYSLAGLTRNPLFANSYLSTAVALYAFTPIFLVSLLALVVFAVFPTAALLSARSAPTSHKWTQLAFFSALASGLVVATFLTGRREFDHLNFLSPFLYVILAFFIAGTPTKSRPFETLKHVAALALLFSFILFGMIHLWQPLTAGRTLETARGPVKMYSLDPGLVMSVRAFSAGETVLVYPHEPMYYFLSATFSPTRFDFLQPGMNTPDQFEQAARDLAGNPPQLVLFQSAFRRKAQTIWASTPRAQFSHVDPVEDFLKANYTPCPGFALKDYWESILMARKVSACPAPTTALRTVGPE